MLFLPSGENKYSHCCRNCDRPRVVVFMGGSQAHGLGRCCARGPWAHPWSLPPSCSALVCASDPQPISDSSEELGSHTHRAATGEGTRPRV